MPSTDMTGVARWLATKCDSHGIFLESHLKGLEEHGITFNPKTAELMDDGGRKIKAPLHDEEWFKKSIEERGLGGWVNLKGERGFWGLAIAETLCVLLGVEPCAMFFGRGRNYQGCIENLRAAGRA